MKEITCSKHSIEEYINDNPTRTNWEKHLIWLFAKMLSKVKTKEAKFHKYTDRQASIIRYDNQAIVYNNYHIITYYRIVNLTINNYIKKRRNLVGSIIGRKEKEKLFKPKLLKPKKIKRNLAFERIEKILNWTAEKEWDLKYEREKRALQKRNSKLYTKRNLKILKENWKGKIILWHLSKIFK